MIAYIKGKIKYTTGNGVVIDVQGIGYEIRTVESYRLNISEGQEAELFVYHHITENGQGLFGFEDLSKREFFIQLISVSGIGPQSALKIMEVAVETIQRAILNADIEALKELPGVGKRTAERIILDLQNKIVLQPEKPSLSQKLRGDENSDSPHTTPLGNIEALDALLSLGYSRLEATRMLSHVPIDMNNVQDIIRYALKSGK